MNDDEHQEDEEVAPVQTEASSDEEGTPETESTPTPVKETSVNTSWARATLGGGTWSLFGDTSTMSVDEALLARKNAPPTADDEEMSDEESDSSPSSPLHTNTTQVVSTTELELGKPTHATQTLRTMKFF